MSDGTRLFSGTSGGPSPLEVLNILSTRLDAIERSIDEGFKRAAEDREKLQQVENRLWKIVLAVGGVAVLEVVQLIIRRP